MRIGPPLFLALLSASVLPGAAAALDPVALQAGCEAGRAEDCLALARARTGVGLPVDVEAARDAYQRACSLGVSEGCLGAQGIGRMLGRHVELALLSSVPRVWLLAGPHRVTAQGLPGPAAAGDAEAIAARLPFAEACYRAGVDEDVRLEGLVDLTLEVAGGRVAGVAVHQASLPDADVARCIAEELGRASLPAGSPDGSIFLRLRAEPAPAASTGAPVVQDHLADGAQVTVGDPGSGAGDRRLEVAWTVAVRQGLAGAACALDEVRAGRWAPVSLQVEALLPADGEARSLRVTPSPADRQQLADCVGRELQGLRVGQTGRTDAVQATLQVRVAPAWTATIVP
ncbi:hypothetical protein L6R53_15375 [Myxococcota bacterium]|nr:hypothetical protein [Myxococcota bacterium]